MLQTGIGRQLCFQRNCLIRQRTLLYESAELSTAVSSVLEEQKKCIIYIDAIDNSHRHIGCYILFDKIKELVKVFKLQIINIEQFIGSKIKINILLIIIQNGIKRFILTDTVIKYTGHYIMEDIILSGKML